MLFTDECRVALTHCDGYVRVWTRRGKQYMPHVIQEVDNFGQGSVMVRSGISIEGHTDLAVFRGKRTAAEYIEQILLQHMVPTVVALNSSSCTLMPECM